MKPVQYLSTLSFEPAMLDRLRAVSPESTIRQLTVSCASQIPAEIWSTVEVLHTSNVLPPPGAAPRLRWVQLDTSGVDHLRDQPVWDSGCIITTLGGVGPVSLAEYVLFSVLGMAHRLPQLVAARAEKYWPTPQHAAKMFTPTPVRGTVMTVVGYGRIGAEIARLAGTFGISVIGVARSGGPRAESGSARYDGRAIAARPAAPELRSIPVHDPIVPFDGAVALVGADRLDDAIELADWLVVVVPRTPDTVRLLDEQRLRRLKPSAVLINVSRGGIVDEAALLTMLRAKLLAGAVLDVFHSEPLPPDSPWWTEPSVFLTPHIGGLTADYGAHVEHLVIENLSRFVAGEPLLNVVDRDRGY